MGLFPMNIGSGGGTSTKIARFLVQVGNSTNPVGQLSLDTSDATSLKIESINANEYIYYPTVTVYDNNNNQIQEWHYANWFYEIGNTYALNWNIDVSGYNSVRIVITGQENSQNSSKWINNIVVF